jgi:hypothetical protein
LRQEIIEELEEEKKSYERENEKFATEESEDDSLGC